MVQIAINNTFLETDRTLSIPMVEEIGFDEFLSIPGEKSWKFSIPKTPLNRRALDLSDVPDVVWSPQTNYDCTLYLNNKPFKNGKLYIENDDAFSFNVYFIGNIGSLKELFSEKSLKSLNWPTVTGISDMFDYAKTVAQDNTSYDLVFPPLASPDENERLAQFYRFNGLEWTEDPPGTFTYTGYDNSYINLLAPSLYFRTIWAQIETDYGITIEGEILEDTEINTLFLLNLFVLNKKDANGVYLNTFPTEIEYQTLVPDVTIETFILSYCQLFNLIARFDLNTNTLKLVYRKNLSKLDRVVWDDKLINYNTKFEAQKTISLGYEYDKEDTEVFGHLTWSETLEGVDGPAGSETVESELSTLPMVLLTSYSAKAPVTASGPDTDIGLKALFYRGIKYPAGHTFIIWTHGPYATSESNNVHYNSNYTLLWQGDNNLKEKFWDEYLTLITPSRTLKLTLRLTTNDIQAFDPLKVYVINGWKCLVKKLEYTLQEKESTVEAEVLKI